VLEEVKQYCHDRNNQVNPEAFFDFYSSKGWMVGKNKMKDWKACVRTWERRDAKPTETNYTQRQYTDDEIASHFKDIDNFDNIAI
jgi:hypothetical protein